MPLAVKRFGQWPDEPYWQEWIYHYIHDSSYVGDTYYPMGYTAFCDRRMDLKYQRRERKRKRKQLERLEQLKKEK